MVDKRVLHMLSGGRDSLLTTSLLCESGYEVALVTFDNGHIEGIRRVTAVAKTLSKKYSNRIVSFDCTQVPSYLSYQKTAMTFHEYMQQYWAMSPETIAEYFPGLKAYQTHCLGCKAAMYVHALAICIQHECKYLSEGVRRSQGFGVDKEEFINRFSALCSKYGVKLLTPLYDLESDQQRKRMLCDRGLPTKTLEPQCFLGCKLEDGGISETELCSLTKFYDGYLRRIMERDIERLTESKLFL